MLNRIVGHTAHEWLCPFRAYSTTVLRSMPFLNNSDDHVFDLEMLVGCVELDEQLDEVEVPVAPDAAFSLSDCIRLAKDSLIAALRYRFHKMGFGTGSTAFNSLAYEVKMEENSSHDGLLRWLTSSTPAGYWTSVARTAISANSWNRWATPSPASTYRPRRASKGGSRIS